MIPEKFRFKYNYNNSKLKIERNIILLIYFNTYNNIVILMKVKFKFILKDKNPKIKLIITHMNLF